MKTSNFLDPLKNEPMKLGLVSEIVQQDLSVE